jgi:hypothetical protein
VNPRKRNILKLKARQTEVVTPAVPLVEPTKRKAVPEEVAEEVVVPVAEEPKVKPTKTKRKRAWKV